MNAVLVTVLGATFGAGLVLSGMTDPAYIRGFLDVTGDWRPELAFVMAGALALSLPFFQLVQPKMTKPVFSSSFSLPTASAVDARLLIGAAIFGIGWTVSGYCPGPGVASFAYLEPKAFGFVAAMLVGFKIADWFAPAK